ncbi:MAG: hypothetical protein M3M94_07075, partial [Actinomycetota bacterium]|nr:hypothetical protein [Actinomycetota bacterium]
VHRFLLPGWTRRGRRPFVAAAALAPLVLVVSAGGGAPRTIVQQISSDPYTNRTSQHQTQVEPDTFAFGQTVVSAFQTGRFFNGGASNIGWATSTDGGRTWSKGFLPNLTVFATPPGRFDRVSDPVVAYDAAHRVWLISTLTVNEARGGFRTALLVNRSRNGLRWGTPLTVSPLSTRFGHDKNWIVCDNGRASRFRGRCYISYTRAGGGDGIATTTSRNGGKTWSKPVESKDRAARGVGAQPVVRPNGDLVISFLSADTRRMLAIRSTNGGASFGAARAIARVRSHAPPGLRAFQLPSSEVDGAGRIYVAWHDCRYRRGCSGENPSAPNDIVYARSRDGIRWSAPRRVPIDGLGSGVDHVIPGLAVHPGTRGRRTRLALAYYSVSPTPCSPDTCRFNVGFLFSRNGGATWSGRRRLNTEPMALSWFANTNSGRMLGDYISTSFVGRSGTAVSAFALASAPRPSFNEAIFAATVPTARSPLPRAPARAVTLSAALPVVVYGASVRLAGAVSSRRAGESVTVAHTGRIRTRARGIWNSFVRPRFSRGYRAHWRGVTSETVAIRVRPRVTLAARGRALFVRVAAARSFAGRRVVLQRLDRGRWRAVERAVLGTRSTARFRTRGSSGDVLRVVLPRSQAVRGYVAGFSSVAVLGRRR